ncbi:hypothetical protein EYF80_044344 [Liparis tanakae]|uniref:Uncharacterized protein n=1 Tax=Liparis tanakae TaxID=230148 RepID=A0A4Z2FX70_9TELE|nr:hypothetical protein EYF80_044344 [Liparis tanakae]
MKIRPMSSARIPPRILSGTSLAEKQKDNISGMVKEFFVPECTTLTQKRNNNNKNNNNTHTIRLYSSHCDQST